MNIAFVGYAGSGKTTIAKKFAELNPDFVYVNIDEEVNKLYFENDMRKFIINILGEYSYCFLIDKFYPNKDFILNKLNNDNLKLLENKCLEKLKYNLESNKNYIFDGIQAYKYQKELKIDKITYVSCNKKIRKDRLIKKDWSKDKIKRIEKLQKDYKFKKYDYMADTTNSESKYTAKILKDRLGV